MDLIHQLDIDRWNPRVSAQQQETALTALESGKVIFLPNLRFEIPEKTSSAFFLPPSRTASPRTSA